MPGGALGEKHKPPLLMSAGLVAVLSLYIDFASGFVLGRNHFYMPYSLVSELASVVAAYLIVELTANRLKLSAGRKAFILAAITLVPFVLLKLFL